MPISLKTEKKIEKYTVFFLIWTIFWIFTVIKAPISAWMWRMMQLFNHHQWSARLFSPITTLKRWYHLLTIKHFTKMLTNIFVNSSNNWRFTVFINRNPFFGFFCNVFFSSFIQTEPFNILSLICEWVKSISRCSHIQLTAEMQALYIEIYEYHALVHLNRNLMCKVCSFWK